MIVKMIRYDFVLYSGEHQRFLERLQDLGIIRGIRLAKMRILCAFDAQLVQKSENLIHKLIMY